MSGDLTLDQPALAIKVARKATPERAAQRGQGPLATAIAAVEPDDALRDPERFERVLQIGFGVVARVSEDAVQRRPLMSLGNEGAEVWDVPGRTQVDASGEKEGRLELGHEGDFDPTGPFDPSRRSAIAVIVTDVAGVQAGGVDGRDGLVGNQATIAGRSDESVEEGVEGSFFSKRFSATQRVE
jgi:hypothetical protein